MLDTGGVGGIERHVAILAAGLRRAGYEARITLLKERAGNPWLAQLRHAGLDWEALEGGVAGLARLLRCGATGLLHTHGYKAGILGRLAARAAGVPVVSTFHAGETGAFPVSLYQRVDEWTSCLGGRVSVSAAIAKRLPFRSRLVPNFIEAPDAAPAAPLPNAVGFVGRLSFEKGPDLFCELAELSGADAAWHVFGDGPMRAGLESRHGAKTAFHGVAANMDRVWPRLGLLVISSRAEGLPMAALEAMAAGVPVAAASVGALPDVVKHGENGWLFPPGDMVAMRRAISEWETGRAARGAGWRAKAWLTAKRDFSVEAGVRQTLEAYAAAGFRRLPPFR